MIKDIYYIQNGLTRIMIQGIPAVDTYSFNIKSFFEEANSFIEVAMLTGGKVLIHCKEGISRSPTVAIAYLMMRKNMSALEAVKHVRGRRTVQPNDGFLAQLIDLDERLRKEKAIMNFQR